MTAIEVYDDRDVVGVLMQLVNVGDGLSESMKITPVPTVPMKIGQRGHVVVEYVVKEVKHRPATKGDFDGPLVLVGVLSGEYAVITDNRNVVSLMNKHKAAVHKYRDEIEGQGEFDLDDDQALEDKEKRLAADEAAANGKKTAKEKQSRDDWGDND